MKTFRTRNSVIILVISLPILILAINLISKKQTTNISKPNYVNYSTINNSNLFNKIEILVNKEDYNQAIKLLEDEIKTHPNTPDSYYLLGKIYESVEFENGKYYQKMDYYYNKYLTLAPKGEFADKASLKIAQYYISIGLKNQDVAILDKALLILNGLDKSNKDVKMALGAIYLNKQNYDKAISEFEKSAGLEPNELIIKYNSLGYAYIKNGDFKNARKVLEIAAVIDSGNKFVHNNLGHVYFKQGEFELAKKSFVNAIKIDPAYEKAIANLNDTESELKKRTANE